MEPLDREVPRRWRRRLAPDEKHPTGRDSEYVYGCYFPGTDLNVGQMGGRGTGADPRVEWIDPKPEHLKA